MNVSHLQHFLQSLAQPLGVSGAKKAAEDLWRACGMLDAFKEMTIAQFADFLAAAKTYAETGVVPTTRSRRSSRRTAAADPQAIQKAAEHLKALYEGVSSPDVTYAAIDAEIKKIDKQFRKDEVLQIASAMGIGGTFKTKKAAIEEIHRRITERKETAERTRF